MARREWQRDRSVTGSRSVELLHGADKFGEIAPHWDRIQEIGPGAPFYLLRGCWQAYLQFLEEHTDRMIFVLLKQGQNVHGIIPLHPDTKLQFGIKFRLWSVPVCSHLSLTGVLLDPSESLADWWPLIRDSLNRAGNTWHALHIPAFRWSDIAPPEPSSLAKDAIYRVQDRSCYLDACKSYSELSQGYSGQLRSNLKHGRKNLGKTEAVYACSATTPSEYSEAFEDFLSLEASGWKADIGAAASNTADRSFLNAVFVDDRLDGLAEIHRLYAGGQVVAAQLAILRNQTRSVVKIAHDEALRRYSPGSVLMDSMIRKSCESEDIRVFSFVTGLDWMDAWGCQSQPTGDLWLFRSRALVIARNALRIRDRRQAKAPS